MTILSRRDLNILPISKSVLYYRCKSVNNLGKRGLIFIIVGTLE